jgi:hypothetical protein
MPGGGCERVLLAARWYFCDNFPMMNCHPHRSLYRLYRLFHLFQTGCADNWNSFWVAAGAGVTRVTNPLGGLA